MLQYIMTYSTNYNKTQLINNNLQLIKYLIKFYGNVMVYLFIYILCIKEEPDPGTPLGAPLIYDYMLLLYLLIS